MYVASASRTEVHFTTPACRPAKGRLFRCPKVVRIGVSASNLAPLLRYGFERQIDDDNGVVTVTVKAGDSGVPLAYDPATGEYRSDASHPALRGLPSGSSVEVSPGRTITSYHGAIDVTYRLKAHDARLLAEMTEARRIVEAAASGRVFVELLLTQGLAPLPPDPAGGDWLGTDFLFLTPGIIAPSLVDVNSATRTVTYLGASRDIAAIPPYLPTPGRRAVPAKGRFAGYAVRYFTYAPLLPGLKLDRSGFASDDPADAARLDYLDAIVPGRVSAADEWAGSMREAGLDIAVAGALPEMTADAAVGLISDHFGLGL